LHVNIVHAGASPLAQEEDAMDADQFTRKGAQFNCALKTRWSRFRDQHLVQCEGNDDQVVDQAHDRYGDKKTSS